MGFGRRGILCRYRHGCAICGANAVRARRNTLLRPLVNAIDRIPLNEHSSEASYEAIVTTDAKRAADIRDFLNERLETVNYPIRETKVVYRSNDNVEIAAKLVSLAVDQEDLAAVVAELSKLPGVNHATWNVSTLE